MRKSLILGAVLAFAVPAFAAAQTQQGTHPGTHQNPPAHNAPQNEAVKSPNTQQTSVPVEGRNSFTEGQAKSRIEDKGFTGVSGLKKDDSGVWRGKAMKDGKSMDVSLDYQGNVVAR